MSWWNKRKQKTVGEEFKVNIISIATKNKGNLMWEVSPWEGTEKISPWKDFYKWYFGREGKSFIMRTTTSETMILRDSIVGFTVKILTKMG